MPELNNIKIINHLPANMQFKEDEEPIIYRGRHYQLSVGEKHTLISKRINSFFKVFFVIVFTGFMGLYFKNIRKECNKFLYANRTIKRYVPIFPLNENHLKGHSTAHRSFSQMSSLTNKAMMSEALLSRQKKEESKNTSFLVKESSFEEAATEEAVRIENSNQKQLDVLLEIIQTDAQRDLLFR